jgi:hypothetical protein
VGGKGGRGGGLGSGKEATRFAGGGWGRPALLPFAGGPCLEFGLPSSRGAGPKRIFVLDPRSCNRPGTPALATSGVDKPPPTHPQTPLNKYTNPNSGPPLPNTQPPRPTPKCTPQMKGRARLQLQPHEAHSHPPTPQKHPPPQTLTGRAGLQVLRHEAHQGRAPRGGRARAVRGPQGLYHRLHRGRAVGVPRGVRGARVRGDQPAGRAAQRPRHLPDL